MSDTLALLVTYHNERAWLTECLASILSQPGAPDEILIYDDASEHPARDYVPGDARIRVLRGEQNIGPARARNILLNATQATFVHFHDSDDLFLDGWCRQVRAAMSAADVVITEVQSETPFVLGLATAGDDLVRFALRGAVTTVATTFRRELAQRVGGYNERLNQSEDWEFHIRLLAQKPVVRIITDELVYVRKHGEQRSSRVVEVWESAVEAIGELSSILPRDYDADLAQAAVRAGRRLYAAGATLKARRAFMLARWLNRGGAVPFADRRMRVLARVVGPINAERVAKLYRGLRGRA